MNEYIFLGDSITDCEHLCDPAGLGDGYVRFISECLSPDQIALNLGYDGFTIAALNRLWNRRSAFLNPSHINILIGINDVGVMKNTGRPLDLAFTEFKTSYEALIRSIRARFNCPITLMEPFIFPYPQEFVTWYPEVQRMSQTVQHLAQEHHLQFLPTWNALLECCEKEGFHHYTTDGIHLTEKGHHFLAHLWLTNIKGR